MLFDLYRVRQLARHRIQKGDLENILEPLGDNEEKWKVLLQQLAQQLIIINSITLP